MSGDLIVGTDEERSLTSSIKTCFPGAVMLLCTRHLEQNLLRHMDAKGVPKATRKKVAYQFYGPAGLSAAESETEFERKKRDLSASTAEFIDPDYFDTVCGKVWGSVVQPRLLHDFVPVNWKNNACESMNHVSKRF